MKVLEGCKVGWDETGLVTSLSPDNLFLFCLGCAEYPDENGRVIPVFFTARQAFFFVENISYPMADEDIWSKEDVKSEYVNGGLRCGGFPTAFDGQYVEIASADFDDTFDVVSDVDMERLKEMGIGTQEIADDIKARLTDLSKFRKETDFLNR